MSYAHPARAEESATAREARQSRRPVLLFDSDCNFCRACVRWLLERDSRGALTFAGLETEPAGRLLKPRGLPEDYCESVVLIDEADRLFMKSDAVLESMRRLDRRWRPLSWLRVFPRWLRDPVYDLISNHRPAISRAVGTINRRWEPPPQVRDRFLAL